MGQARSAAHSQIKEKFSVGLSSEAIWILAKGKTGRIIDFHENKSTQVSRSIFLHEKVGVAVLPWFTQDRCPHSSTFYRAKGIIAWASLHQAQELIFVV